jgi:hypothetical protein
MNFTFATICARIPPTFQAVRKEETLRTCSDECPGRHKRILDVFITPKATWDLLNLDVRNGKELRNA